MPTAHSDLVLLGSIDDTLVQRLTRELQHDRYQRHIPLRLFISSPGGSMPLALTLARLLLSLFDHIETYNLATADSAAVCLYLTGSKRHSFASSRFFLHPASIAITHRATEDQLQENLRLIRSDTNAMVHFYQERTGIGQATLRQWFGVPTVLTSHEAIAHGIATDLCTDIQDFSPHYLTSDVSPQSDDTAAGHGAQPALPSTLPMNSTFASPCNHHETHS